VPLKPFFNNEPTLALSCVVVTADMAPEDPVPLGIDYCDDPENDPKGHIFYIKYL
jgi:hypothetical protein